MNTGCPKFDGPPPLPASFWYVKLSEFWEEVYKFFIYHNVDIVIMTFLVEVYLRNATIHLDFVFHL